MNIIKVVTVCIGGQKGFVSYGREETTFLYTDLPPCQWPDTESPTLRLDIKLGHAREYIAANFPGIPHEFVGDVNHRDNG